MECGLRERVGGQGDMIDDVARTIVAEREGLHVGTSPSDEHQGFDPCPLSVPLADTTLPASSAVA
jgi:hypothetical protein